MPVSACAKARCEEVRQLDYVLGGVLSCSANVSMEDSGNNGFPMEIMETVALGVPIKKFWVNNFFPIKASVWCHCGL